MSLSKNAVAGPPASLEGVSREARRRKASPARLTAGAVFLVALLAAGPGLPQDPPSGEDAPASSLFRQGTIHEQELPVPGPGPAPAIRLTAPRADAPAAPQPGPRANPAPAPTAPTTDFKAVAFEKPDGSYELPPLDAGAGAALPQRRASMKLVQQGRTLLQAETYKAALARFEQAVGVDAANPYSHYFIARSHYFLHNYRESLSFLDVAESRLAADARWLAEVHVLRARNAAAIGFHGQADVNYIRALRLDPGHAFALAQLTTIDTVGDAGKKP